MIGQRQGGSGLVVDLEAEKKGLTVEESRL